MDKTRIEGRLPIDGALLFLPPGILFRVRVAVILALVEIVVLLALVFRCAASERRPIGYLAIGTAETHKRNTVHLVVVAPILALRLDILGLGDPVEIAAQILFDLLLLAQLVKVAARLRLFPFLRELARFFS